MAGSFSRAASPGGQLPISEHQAPGQRWGNRLFGFLQTLVLFVFDTLQKIFGYSGQKYHRIITRQRRASASDPISSSSSSSSPPPTETTPMAPSRPAAASRDLPPGPLLPPGQLGTSAPGRRYVSPAMHRQLPNRGRRPPLDKNAEQITTSSLAKMDLSSKDGKNVSAAKGFPVHASRNSTSSTSASLPRGQHRHAPATFSKLGTLAVAPPVFLPKQPPVVVSTMDTSVMILPQDQKQQPPAEAAQETQLGSSAKSVVNGHPVKPLEAVPTAPKISTQGDADEHEHVRVREDMPTEPLSQVNGNSQLAKSTRVVPLIGEQIIKARVPILNVGIQYSPEERAVHTGFINDALDMARLALRTNETPVGCVIVCDGRVIAKGMNATNVTRNGTRHAELMALSALLSFTPESDLDQKKTSGKSHKQKVLQDKTNSSKPVESAWGDVDPRDGHLYPYGQKMHPSPRVDKSVIRDCTLYVTVEPCVMCASLLRQLRIKKVFFGAVNDKFGGTGGVFRVHQNAPAQRSTMAPCPASPTLQKGFGFTKPAGSQRAASAVASTVGVDLEANSESATNTKENESPSSDPPEAPAPAEPAVLEGDGGQVEPGYEVEGGWGRDDAVTLLRQFYVQENGRAPVPRKKEGRAARLAAMMERDGHAGGPMIPAGDAFPCVGTSSLNSTSTDRDGQDAQSLDGGSSKNDKASENSGSS